MGIGSSTRPSRNTVDTRRPEPVSGPGPLGKSGESQRDYDARMRARIVALDELTSTDLVAWSDCAAASLEPNPFFEPSWLLPAIKYLDGSPRTMLVLAEHHDAVYACMPIAEVAPDAESSASHRTHLALKTLVAPAAVTLGTPIVAATGGSEALACLMTESWREAARRGAGLVVMEWVANDGPVASLLREVANQTNNPLIEFDVWERGFLRRQSGGDEDPYWLRGIGKNRRRTIRQHHQKLTAAFGRSPSLRVRTDGGAVDDFLRLEASGWKGRQPDGVALRRHAATTNFFEAVCGQYLDAGRMSFLSLEEGGSSIAMICCVRSGAGVFAYRTAFDEELARFGPGVELFLSAMEHFDRDTDASWFDTCAARDNEHLLGLFPDRRAMATVMFRVPDSGEPNSYLHGRSNNR